MKKVQWRWFDHRTDLPQWLKSRIGQIAAEWSVLERELEQLIHLLTDTEIAFTRIITLKMNAQTRILAVGYLIEWYVYERALDPAFLLRFNVLGERIAKSTQMKRDMVTHGLWSKTDRKWRVLRLRAKRGLPNLEPELKKLSRAVLPQTEVITRESLDATVRQIVVDAKALQALCNDLYAVLSPSRYKPPAYTRRRPSTPKKRAQSARP